MRAGALPLFMGAAWPGTGTQHPAEATRAMPARTLFRKGQVPDMPYAAAATCYGGT